MVARRQIGGQPTALPDLTIPDLAGQDLLELLAQVEGPPERSSPFSDMSDILRRLMGLGLPSQAQQDPDPIRRRQFKVPPMQAPSVTPNPPRY